MIFECSSFTAVHDALADSLRISDLFQEAAVFAYTRNTESGILSTNTNHKHIEWDLVGRNTALDFGVIVDVDNLLLVVDLGSFGFVVLDRSLLVAKEIADRLHDAAVFDRSSGT